MARFPAHLLKPLSAAASTLEGRGFIDIDFEPLEGIPPEGSEFDGRLSLGYIQLPSLRLADLAGQSFAFDTGCETRGIYPGEDAYGCIEGSIYFAHANQPVYVSKLSFGAVSGGQMPMSVESLWDLSSEAVGLDAFEVRFTVPLGVGQ